MNTRKKHIDNHRHKIWQGKNGYWYTYIENRKLIKRKNRVDLENIIIEHAKKKNLSTIESIFYQWINEKLSYKEITKQTYDRYICDFKRYFANINDLKLEYISEPKLEEIVKTFIRDFNPKAKAWTNYKILLKGIFKFAKKMKLTEISISSFLGDLDIPKNSIKKNMP